MILIAFSLGTISGISNKDLAYIKSGNYNEININDLAGQSGGIEVLNSKNKVIFKSGYTNDNTEYYTDSELSCIDNYGTQRENIQNSKLTGIDGQSEILIQGSRGSVKDSTNFDVNVISYSYNSDNQWYQILNNNLDVIASSTPEYNTIKKYTKLELEYLLNDLPENYQISKYSFIANNGKKYTLIINSKKLENQIIGNRIKYDLMIFSVFAIIIYLGFILLFVAWINKKVKRPAEKLNEAMISFSNNERVEITDYKGTAELMQICDNFNMMLTKLKDSENKRQALEDEKQRIISDISHDLKTPITSIKGYSKALLDNMVSEQDKPRIYRIFYNKSEKLTDLINTFYDYSRIVHPDLKFKFEKLDICEFIRSYIINKYDDIYDLGFELELDIPDEKFMCNIDNVQMIRAIDNILNNALKHNDKGTEIFISIYKEDHKYKIDIANNGKQIEKEIAKNIFEPFVVGDASRNTKGGTGLGMSITKKIIKEHGGNIILRSSEKYTTIFEIKLPVD